jgi:hypothetical protein
MNRAMPSRATMLFALSLLLVASVGMWVRSYWRFDVVGLFGYALLSESGEIYSVGSMDDGDHYFTGTAGRSVGWRSRLTRSIARGSPSGRGGIRAIDSSQFNGGRCRERSRACSGGAGGGDRRRDRDFR